MRYRAPRFHVRDLFDGPFPVAMIGGVAHILSDLSTTGLSAIAPAQEEPAQIAGTDIAFRLQFGDVVLHAGEAGVARVEETTLGRKLGIQFRRSELDLEHVVGRYRHELSRGRLRAGFDPALAQAPPGFRILCADILAALRTCRDVLDEERYGPFEGSGALIEDCLAKLSEVLAPLAMEANGMLEGVLEDPAGLGALKRLAGRLLAPDFVLSPLWARAVEKPFGYPGDFRLVRAMHEPAPETGTAYARLLEQLGRHVFRWIPARTKLIVDALAREIAHHRVSEPLRIASIGAGAGEELRALFARGRPSKPLALSLLDQDERAAADAHAALHPQSLHAASPITISCLNASHAKLLKGGELEGELYNQHVILTPTLLDYLRHRAAHQLLEALYARLAPGGVLFAGCLRQHEASARWASELICDWSMIHRTKDEVFALAGDLPRARIDSRLDKNGDIYLLILRKPRADH